jgi:NAD(P)-dependent dehydrogenase (short-subunit alcohol dehydrogenase family)
MDLGLGDKIVIVTGGSKDFGLACARAFLAEDPRVAIVSRAEAKKLGVSPITVSKDLKEAKKE